MMGARNSSVLSLGPYTDTLIALSIILETDSTAIASRCSRPRADPALNLSELKIDEAVSFFPSLLVLLLYLNLLNCALSQSLLHAFSTVRDRVVSRIGQM